jgi:hypothetical protein
MPLSLAPGCGNHDATGGISVTCSEACARCPTGAGLCSDCASYGGRLRDEVEGPLYRCVVRGTDAGGCPPTWEQCGNEAIDAAGERDLDRSFRADCLARRTECQNQMMGFSDDPCLLSAAFEASNVAQAQQCLAKACGEIIDCMEGAF